MSSNPPLREWTKLPDDLEDLPRTGFVRRQPATSEEAEQRKDVIFGVSGPVEAIRRNSSATVKKRRK